MMRNWKGSGGEDHGHIHVGGVVAGVDGGRAPAQILRANTLSLEPEFQTQARAQKRAMRCCALPFLSTNETRSEMLPQSCREQHEERRLDEVGAPAIEPGQGIGTL